MSAQSSGKKWNKNRGKFMLDEVPYTWEQLSKLNSKEFMYQGSTFPLFPGGKLIKIGIQRIHKEIFKKERMRYEISTEDYQAITDGARNVGLGRRNRRFMISSIYFNPKAAKITGSLVPVSPKSNEYMYAYEEKQGYPFEVLWPELMWKFMEERQWHEYARGIYDAFLPNV